ncbi:hypothetical protein [Solilutibacter silvestris]|uniref:hypothetical protein n=1 Tax=Solilutibacter silvestris TaxID=1645665 RepID=UPI003D324D46
MKLRLYLVLATVALISLTAAWAITASDFVKGMIVTPGVGALLGALLQLARDSASHQRQSHLQLDQQIFTLGAGSHMASVAFDKHVEFCEAYMSSVHETVGLLFREGPTSKAVEQAHEFYAIKRKYAAWIPRSVALKLEPFEDALNSLGVQYHLVQALRGDDPETRKKAIDESYGIFRDIMNLGTLKAEDPKRREDIAIENVKEKVRRILGINELFDIRTFIIERSAVFARENGSTTSSRV